MPFLIGCPTVMPLLLWSELPSGANHVTSGMTARYWTTWTVQVREYGCPAIANVERVNCTFGRGRAVGEAMQDLHHICSKHKRILQEVTILPAILMKNELLAEIFLMYCGPENGVTLASQT